MKIVKNMMIVPRYIAITICAQSFARKLQKVKRRK